MSVVRFYRLLSYNNYLLLRNMNTFILIKWFPLPSHLSGANVQLLKRSQILGKTNVGSKLHFSSVQKLCKNATKL